MMRSIKYVWNNKKQWVEVWVNGELWMYNLDARVLNSYYREKYRKH